MGPSPISASGALVSQAFIYESSGGPAALQSRKSSDRYPGLGEVRVGVPAVGLKPVAPAAGAGSPRRALARVAPLREAASLLIAPERDNAGARAKVMIRASAPEDQAK